MEKLAALSFRVPRPGSGQTGCWLRERSSNMHLFKSLYLVIGGLLFACSSALALDTNAIALLSKAPAIQGQTYRCGDMVRAVNSLRHLGKERALAVLKNHLRQNDRYASAEQYWKLHLVCRLLFVNPEGWKYPRLGHAFPDLDWGVAERLPQFPMVLSQGVPFLLLRGYGMGGYTSDTAEKCVELCEKFPLISADLPEKDFQEAAQELIKNETFQKLYSTPAGRKEATEMILAQASGTNLGSRIVGVSTIRISTSPPPETKK
jgi:hypothetical protein